MRILLIGGSGQLGSEIQTSWTDCEISAPSSSELNLADSDAVARAIDEYRADAVVNCAAFHNVDRCECEPQRAFEVNALAVDSVARVCRDRDAVFLTISTDYVFDGETERPYLESDMPHPINSYGVSKLAGELLVERLQMKAFVVRTCGVYSPRISTVKGYTFIDRIIAQARAGEQLRVVSDSIASPTYARHLADGLRKLLDTNAFGLYHCVNAGAVSWHAFATEALRLEGIDREIEPIATADWKPQTRRPRYSALDCAKLAGLNITLPQWEEGLRDYLAAR